MGSESKDQSAHNGWYYAGCLIGHAKLNKLPIETEAPTTETWSDKETVVFPIVWLRSKALARTTNFLCGAEG